MKNAITMTQAAADELRLALFEQLHGELGDAMFNLPYADISGIVDDWMSGVEVVGA